jgi:hypothetical protein
MNNADMANPVGTPGLQGDSKSVPAWLWPAIRAFVCWLEKSGYESYDPYDLWGTRYGLLARRLYYHRNPLGFALIAPCLAIETVWPGLRSIFVHKKRFATADGQLLLAFLNLYALTAEMPYLDEARTLASHLLKISLPGYAGYCWGYPFDWQNNRGLWRKNTPYITATPYCYEGFAHLFAVTGGEAYRDVAVSVARFVHDDLKDTSDGNDGAAAASYSPVDETKVVNASAYRAFVLFDAVQRFGLADYEEKARRNLRFILQNQRPAGSWLYGIGHSADGFIDHFHTCFVLKNLHKLNQHLNSEAVREAIARGYHYYRHALFDGEDNPKYFAIQPRTQFVRLEMYNVAEAITLGTLLRHEIPEAIELARRLARRLVEEYQLPDGHFVTRVYRGGFRHTYPFLRWPQAQLFYALTNLLLAEHVDSRDASMNSLALSSASIRDGGPEAPRQSRSASARVQ